MKKRKTPSYSAKKTVRLAQQNRATLAAKPEVRRAVPLDYVITDEISLRAAPDVTAAKLSGGVLSKGTVVKIATQDWWYVEVERPAAASGVLRGWVSNSVLRRATATDIRMPAPSPAVAAPPTPTDAAAYAELRKRMAESIVKFEGRRDAQGHLWVYILPAGGGGRYEGAEINDRYHPREAAKLRESGRRRRARNVRRAASGEEKSRQTSRGLARCTGTVRAESGRAPGKILEGPGQPLGQLARFRAQRRVVSFVRQISRA